MAKDLAGFIRAVEAEAATLRRFQGNIYLSTVDNADAIHNDREGNIEPYLMIFAPSLDNAEYTGKGIGSSADDSKLGTLIFQVVGAGYMQAQELAQDVRNKFEGLELTTASQLREATSSGSVVPGTSSMRPKRYGVVLFFTFILD